MLEYEQYSLELSLYSCEGSPIPVRPLDVAHIPSPPPTEGRTSSSHVNSRGPPPVPASTPSLSSVDTLGTFPVAAKDVTLSIRQQFGQSWPTWGAIPKDHLELFFQRFKSKELGQFVYVDEIFKQTHLRKDTGQFVDDRSRRTHEEFESRLSQARSDAASSVGESQITPLDPAEEQRLRSRCWVASAGPKRKGCLYGTGDLAHTYKCGNDSLM
ncbi:hypothetical protein HKD37_14G040459 [Glycine soja]